jgi:hypothetical protein
MYKYLQIPLALIFVFAESYTQNNINQLQNGDYLTKKYIRQLMETRSPLISGEDYTTTFFTKIANKREGVKTIFWGDIHSGIGNFEIKKNGKIFFPEEFSIDDEYSIQVINSSEFILLGKKGLRLEFQFVGDYTRWTSKLLFKGKYIDSLNRIFIFTDSMFILPTGEKYLYENQTDCGNGPPLCDCVFLNNTPFSYSVNADTLKLFEVYGTDSELTREQAKWILRKSK